MASTVREKSQPLHNFSLTYLKWNKNHSRHRSSTASRLSTSPRRSPSSRHDSPQRQSPLGLHSPLRGDFTPGSPSLPPLPQSLRQSPACNDSAPLPPHVSPIHGGVVCESDCGLKNKKPLIEYRRQSRNSVLKAGESSPDRIARDEKLEKQSKGPESGNKESRSSSKFVIRIRAKSNKCSEAIKGQEDEKIDDDEIPGEGNQNCPLDDEEPVPKTWNFRPRNPIRKSLNVNGSGFKNIGSTRQEKRVYSTQVNPNANRTEVEKKEKRKKGFKITLSKEEIEEDFYTLIGSKPTRRPTKRSKTAQRQLDNLFPGAWLQSKSADSY